MDKNQMDGLLALKLVAERRNFTAAADELGISPPAISKLIKQLEGRLGVTLLTRTTRSTSLTEAGERFLSQAGPALEQIIEAIKDVGTLGEKPSGRLRLNVPTLIYPNYLKKLISSFMRKYPDVAVEIHFENAATDIFAKGFDAGIRVSDILAKDMIAIKLFGPLRFVVAGSPRYFARVSRPRQPKELLAHNCVRVGTGNRIYDSWEFESKGKAFNVRVNGSLIMNDSILALDAAVDGSGLIYTSEDAITDKIEAGKLEIVLNQFAPTSTGYYLYYPQRSQVQPKLRAFIEHVKKPGSSGSR
jgi:DNA-binding transcriptional LysR family regulator